MSCKWDCNTSNAVHGENWTIFQQVTIGANAVVTKSVSLNSTAVGFNNIIKYKSEREGII